MNTRNVKLTLVAGFAVPLLWVSWVELSYLYLRSSGTLFPEWFSLAILFIFIGAGGFGIIALKNIRLWARLLLATIYTYGMWWLLMFLGLIIACNNGDCI